MIVIGDRERVETDIKSAKIIREPLVIHAPQPMHVGELEIAPDAIRDLAFLEKIADEDKLRCRVRSGGRFEQIPVVGVIDLADAPNDEAARLPYLFNIPGERSVSLGEEVGGDSVVEQAERMIRISSRVVFDEERSHRKSGITQGNEAVFMILDEALGKRIIGKGIMGPIRQPDPWKLFPNDLRQFGIERKREQDHRFFIRRFRQFF